MYSNVTIALNSILYNWNLLRVDFKYSHPKKETKLQLREEVDMLISVIMALIS
jgi:hypothetical protein